MPLLVDEDRKAVEEFFAAIAPLMPAYRTQRFAFLAKRVGASFVLLHGRVYLSASVPTVLPPPVFEAPNLRAGNYGLAELNLGVRELIEQLLAGRLHTPEGDLVFPSIDGARHGASFVPFHPEGLESQTRYNVLTILGGPTGPLRQPDIDWELKAASPPYGDIQELSIEFGLGSFSEQPAYVEIVAYNIAAIDSATSKVAGTNAVVGIRLAKGLARDSLRLGYRVYVPEVATRRGVIAGPEMTWTEEADLFRGSVTLEVPNAAALNCTVSFDGVTQSHFWLGDPSRVQNPRRAAYEAFDPGLEALKTIIAAAQTRGQVARDLEAAVAWLLWMLGFSVAQLGNTPRVRDAADVLVGTPAGHYAVVECTTGLLKAENKLALLHQRTEAVRAKLRAANNTVARVLPAIVTSRPRTEIAADVEAAERLGIFIATREWLNAAVDRTLIQSNADQLYTEAEQAVAAALAKYKTPDPGLGT